MRNVICVMVAMLFLLTACGSSDTTGEKENTKTEGVENSTTDSMENTSNTDSHSVEEKNEPNANETVDKPVDMSVKKEVATPAAYKTVKEDYLLKLNDTKVKVENINSVDSTPPL